MPQEKVVKKANKGDPVYILFRYGKIVTTGNNYPRIFYSKEHFDYHKKHYSGTFLSTDELVKYVPEDEARKKTVKEFAERLKERKYLSSEWSHGEHPYVVEEDEIDDLVEEMIGEQDYATE